MSCPRVVIIGGGFAGINAAKALKKADVQITLLDRSNHHLFQPLLYQVATAALSPGEIAYPLRAIFCNQKNTMVIMGDAAKIDKDSKEVHLGNGEIVPYDYLIIATGARHSYFGNDHWEELAPGLKTISDALTIRENILKSFEKAERINDPEQTKHFMNFVVIGGGPTGVEMAGAIAEIARTTLLGSFRRITPENAKVYLIEGLPHVLPSYSQRLSNRAKKDLEHLGVEVINSRRVTDINDEGVSLGDDFIACKNIIWAAGNQGSKLLTTLDCPLDRQGRAYVKPDLSLEGHPEVFVIGDTAHTAGLDGNPLPGIATVAIQQGRYVAGLIKKGYQQEKRPPFIFFDKGSMATIGKGKAIAKVGKLEFTGHLAWLMWGVIHIAYLIGFRTKLGVLVEWIIVFFTGQRGVRIITEGIEKELPSKD